MIFIYVYYFMMNNSNYDENEYLCCIMLFKKNDY